MSNDVCGYCGKARGWHLWECPELKLKVGLQAYYIDSVPPGAVKAIPVTELKMEPEVE